MKYRKTVALVVLGFTTILTQLVFFREFLNIFQGNEMVLGAIICTWMLSTAAGSRLKNAEKGFPSDHNIGWWFVVHAILACCTTLPLLYIDILIFEPGVTRGLTEAFILCICLLSPYCLLSGYIFSTLMLGLPSLTIKNPASFAFGWESSGSVAAGIAYTLGVFLLDTAEILSLIVITNLLVYLLFYGNTVRKGWISYLSVFILASTIVILPLNSLLIRVVPEAQRPVFTQHTPYGKITVTKTDGQFNIFENGNLFVSSDNKRMAEEAVHFALLQRSKASCVLIVSGGVSGMTKEAQKYATVQRIDFVEINPWLIKTELQFSGTKIHGGVHVISKDARAWIAESGVRYDAIILSSPDPVNAQLNRYFTQEFFMQVAKALNPGGVFEIGLSSTANYMSDMEVELNGTLHSTLKTVFPEVVIIQGEKNYFLASEKPLFLNIAERSSMFETSNEYVNRYFIDDDLLSNNFNTIKGQIESQSRINHDLTPFAYISQIRLWLNKSEGYQKRSILVMFVILVFLLVWLLIRNSVNAANLAIYTSAFAGAASEFLLLVLFQIHFGYVFSIIGLIVGLYMAGLTAGSLIRIRQYNKKYYRFNQLILMILVLFIPVVALIPATGIQPGILLKTSICCLIFSIAFLSGLIYNLAGTHKKMQGGYSQKLYAIDLAGASSGTVLISLIGLPVLGLIYSCIISALLVITGMIINRFSAGEK